MEYAQHPMYARYEELWQTAWPLVHQGQVTPDTQIQAKAQDNRRGITLIARLDPAVVQRIGDFQETLRAIEPEQYYYPATDIHLTILSLFTATVDYQPYLANIERYQEAIRVALKGVSAFELDTSGITLSTGAVMTQGFTSETLNTMRDHLRAELTTQGFGGDLDQRYRLRIAHNTIIRFVAPLRDATRFAQTLREYRAFPFGISAIRHLDMVLNDWYMSEERLTLLQQYALS